MFFIDLINSIPALMTLLLVLESWLVTAKVAFKNLFNRSRKQFKSLFSSYQPSPVGKPRKWTQQDYQQYKRWKHRNSFSYRMRRWASLDMARNTSRNRQTLA